MIETPYVLPRRFVLREVAPWALLAFLITVGMFAAYTGALWLVVHIPRIAFVRTFVGVVVALGFGLVLSTFVGQCFMKGKLTDAREAARLSVLFVVIAAVGHVWVCDHATASLHYGLMKMIGLALLAAMTVFGAWITFEDEIFCEQCLSWGARKRKYLRIPGVEPLAFLQQVESGQKKELTEKEEEAAEKVPCSVIDVWKCTCGATCAVQAVAIEKEGVEKRVLKLSAISGELARRIEAIREGEDARTFDGMRQAISELAAQVPEREVFYSESRPVGRGFSFWFGISAITFFGALCALGIVVVGATLFTSFRHHLAGLPAPELTERLKDFVFTSVLGGFTIYYGLMAARVSIGISQSSLEVELDDHELSVRFSRGGPPVTFLRKEIQELAVAEFNAIVEGARLKQDKMLESIVLGTSLYVTRGAHQHGVRLTLRSGDVRCIGLRDPEAFFAAWSRSMSRPRHSAQGLRGSAD